MGKPNEHGVYLEAETLSLPRAVKGWRGSDIADIRVLDLGSCWIWATRFALWSGDHLGESSPLMDRVDVRAPSRVAAIEAASAHLRDRLGDRPASYPDARAIVAWLDTLQPDQLDLFGVAA